MANSRRSASILTFFSGLVSGAVLVGFWAYISNYDLVDGTDQAELLEELAELKEENRLLSDDLLRTPRLPLSFDPNDLPYDGDADARAELAKARAEAAASGRFLMVTFGANWCIDCRTLYVNLNSDDVNAYAKERFVFTNVDVDKFNRNIDLAAELGVDLHNGIPVAIFYAQDGRVIGTTNQGELEPARLYTSKQILKFMRDVAERSRIVAPDSVY